MKHPVYIIYFSLCAVLLTGILWTAPAANAAGGDADDAAIALAALSGRDVGGDTGAKRRPDRYNGDSSFFEDSSFMDSGLGSNTIDEEEADPVANAGEEPDILEPIDKDNPKNPQTGQPYTNAAMEKFATLRKRFPNNDLIPRKKSKTDLEKEAETRKRMFALQSVVVQGNASTEEVNDYYDMQSKAYQDRKELLTYVFESMGDKMSDDIKEQYEKVQRMNEQQLKMLADQRDRALSKAGSGQ